MSQMAVYVKSFAGQRAARLRARTPGWALILAIILLIGVSGLRATAVRAGASNTVVSESLVAGPYTLTLQIGPPLQLWTPEEARKMHPRVGDIVFRGATASGSTATPTYHLNLHIMLRTLGTVISNVVVAITITTPDGTVVQHVPVGLMRGVGKGPSDTHYGNNISVKPGRYRVVVQAKRTTATFDVTLGT